MRFICIELLSISLVRGSGETLSLFCLENIMSSTINQNVESIEVIKAASAEALETAVNTAITTINTAGTSAVTKVDVDIERLPGENVYVAVLTINGITSG